MSHSWVFRDVINMSSQTFNFSKETPPDVMFSDIQALNKFEDEVTVFSV